MLTVPLLSWKEVPAWVGGWGKATGRRELRKGISVESTGNGRAGGRGGGKESCHRWSAAELRIRLCGRRYNLLHRNNLHFYQFLHSLNLRSRFSLACPLFWKFRQRRDFSHDPADFCKIHFFVVILYNSRTFNYSGPEEKSWTNCIRSFRRLS